jgi:hypothetical protein
VWAGIIGERDGQLCLGNRLGVIWLPRSIVTSIEDTGIDVSIDPPREDPTKPIYDYYKTLRKPMENSTGNAKYPCPCCGTPMNEYMGSLWCPRGANVRIPVRELYLYRECRAVYRVPDPPKKKTTNERKVKQFATIWDKIKPKP